MILPILQYGDPILRAKGERVEKIDERVRELAANMIETMHAAHGVGLAAQQVGQPLADLAAVLRRHRLQHAVCEIGDAALDVGAELEDRRRVGDVEALFDGDDAVLVGLGCCRRGARHLARQLADRQVEALRLDRGKRRCARHRCSGFGRDDRGRAGESLRPPT